MMPYCSFPHPQFHRSIFATNLDYFPHQIFRGGPPFCTSSRFNPFLRMLLCSDYVSLCCRGYVNQYFDNKEEDVHKDTFRQIAIDVPRMSPLVGLFQQRLVQEMVERILYIWAIRSPPTWICYFCFEKRLWKHSCCIPLICVLASILVYGRWCAGTLPLAMSRVLTTSSLLSSWFSFRLSPFSLWHGIL